MATQANPVSKNPYINRIFLEWDFNKVGREGNVLVVETTIKPEEKNNHLDDVLVELDEIQAMAEQRIGSFDRIDIRFV